MNERHFCPTCDWHHEGHCHFDPPSAQLLMAQNMAGQSQPQPIAFHPPVRRDGFCSKHSEYTKGRLIEGTH